MTTTCDGSKCWEVPVCVSKYTVYVGNCHYLIQKTKNLSFAINTRCNVMLHLHILTFILSITDICRMTQDPGPCDGAVPQYFFDWRANQCVQFSYGGCGGNANRFTALDDCENFCRGQCQLQMLHAHHLLHAYFTVFLLTFSRRKIFSL